MPDRLTCEEIDARDLVHRYVATTLPEDEADALEAHMLGCDACWRELQQGLEIRAASLRAELSRAASSGPQAAAGRLARSLRPPRRWAPLAAAAAVVVLAAGAAWQWGARDHGGESVQRGGGGALAPVASLTPEGALEVEWTPDPAAAIYRVRLSSAAGESATERVTSPAVTFPADTMQRFENASIQVEAENVRGEVIARSRVVPVVRR